MDDARATTAEALCEGARALQREGLSPGHSGNLSFRRGSGFVITPTGAHPEALTPERLARLALDGRVLHGEHPPSSEWPLHAAIYRARPDVGAVVHVHSPYATILACTRRAIPPLHYMIGVASADEIPCAPYADFGSEALAEGAAAHLGPRGGVLLANHGQVAAGRDLAHALFITREIETLARLYWGALAIGGPTLLDEKEMDAVRERIANYGPAAR